MKEEALARACVALRPHLSVLSIRERDIVSKTINMYEEGHDPNQWLLAEFYKIYRSVKPMCTSVYK